MTIFDRMFHEGGDYIADEMDFPKAHGPFPARFPRICDLCRGEIRPGDSIRIIDFANGRALYCARHGALTPEANRRFNLK